MSKNRHWTEKEDAVVREHYPRGGAKAVRPYLPHRTDSAIHYRSRVLGAHHYHLWSDEEMAILREYYPKGGWTAVHQQLPHRQHRSIITVAYRHKIKAPSYLKGRGGHFKKGHKPDNTGQPMPEHVRAKCQATQFSTGKPSARAYPIGTKRVNRDNGCVYVKVNDAMYAPPNDNWKLEHRLVYEQHHNVTLTSDDVILHKDGDKTNNDITNLVRATYAELIAYGRSQLAEYPPEVREAIKALSELNKRIKQQRRRERKRS